MKKLVLDASLALAWLFERQEKKEISYADAILTKLTSLETIVPTLWHTEILNALVVGERRRVITEAQMIDYLNKLHSLPIKTDDTPIMERRDSIISLAREHGLTAYDATYLDLALNKNATLATFDGKLAKSMQKAGGELFR